LLGCTLSRCMFSSLESGVVKSLGSLWDESRS
jgi:hypothetical protein